MKTNRFLILILLLLCASLCACGAGNAVTTTAETTVPPETTEATEATTEPTEATTEATEPTTEATEATQNPDDVGAVSVRTEIPGKVLFKIYPTWFQPTGVAEEYMADKFDELFFDYFNWWYMKAMTSLYATPVDVDLLEFLSGGTYEEQWEPLSDLEKELLREVAGDSYDLYGISRISTEQINAVLDAYFGITLEESNKVGLDSWVYLSETDCYYLAGYGVAGTEVEIHSVYRQEDGTYHVYYSDPWQYTDTMKRYPDYVTILQPYETMIEMRFRILANLDAEEFLAGKVTVEPTP